MVEFFGHNKESNNAVSSFEEAQPQNFGFGLDKEQMFTQMLEIQLDDKLQIYKSKVQDRVNNLKKFFKVVTDSIKDIQMRVDALIKSIREFELVEGDRLEQ